MAATTRPKPSMERVASGDSASRQAVTRVNAEQASKQVMWEPTQQRDGEGRRHRFFFRGATRFPPVVPPGYRRRHVCPGRSSATRETPGGGCVTQPDAREGQAGPRGESQRSIVPAKPSNAGGGKGPRFKVNVSVADS